MTVTCRRTRIVIGAGGTAGHVVPALAVADALRADGAEVVFIGGERAERELVPEAGYELHTLRVAPLARRSPVRAARAVAVDAGAVRAARRLIRELRPAAALGAGGYVAGPVGLAAAVPRVPLVLMESDSHLGLTNRLLAPVARRVCLAFPIAGRDGDRYRVTGRPVPAPATDRRRRGSDSGSPTASVRARVRGQPGSPLDQSRRRSRRSPARGSTSCTPPGPRPAGSGDRPGRTTTCAATSPTSARRCWPAIWSWPGPAARCSRWPRTAARWC